MTPPGSPDEHLTAEERLAVSEKRLRLLADNAKDVVWSMSPLGEITYVSQAIEKLRGITPEVAMRQTLTEIVTPDSQREVVGYFEKLHAAAALGEELPTFRGDLEYYRSDGSTFWTEVFAFPLTSGSGELVEILGVTRDISERKLHEDNLMRAREVAERANSAKSRFLAHISHEIRTPITSLLSWIQVASRQNSDEAIRDPLAKAQDAGRVLLGIINDLLDLSRMEHGDFRLASECLSVANIVSQVQALIEPSTVSKGLQCTAHIPQDLPNDLVGDPIRLTQALLNLAGNAVKFTDHGSVHIAVEVESSDQDCVVLRFSVRDTGIGIDPQWQDKLFHDLGQVPEAQNHDRSGAGLGLAICKRLAHQMGGKVGLSSQPRAGSTFWFTAKLRRALAISTRPSASPPDDAKLLAGKKVLVVDDDASIRQATAKLLGLHGLSVELAENGVVALERLKTGPYDVVLLDMLMPEMGGEECARLIRRHFQLTTLPIIGLTAAGFVEDRERCLAAGMSDYLVKPFEFDELMRLLHRHVATRP